MPTNPSTMIHYPIAIVGGGEVGLTTSVLLSLQNVPHILFEKHATTSIHPKAIGLQPRSMEIMHRLGGDVYDSIMAQSALPAISRRTAWYTSLTGKEIQSREGFGYILDETVGGRGDAYRKASPAKVVNLAQIRMEPILRARAEELNPRGILYDHEVESVEESDEGYAEVTFHARTGPQEGLCQTIRATYVVGADGGQFLTEKFGGGWVGEGDVLAEMVTAHIRSPLSLHVPDPSVLIYWFVNPKQGGSVNSGLAYHLGPYNQTPSKSGLNPETEEWSVFVGRRPHERSKPFTQAEMLARLRQMFDVEGLPIDILSISHWRLQAKHATQYVSPKERVFLVGDSAHRIPPWGGVGGNTGLQDAEALAWRLAWAVKVPQGSWDPRGLLRSYHSERMQIGKLVAKTSLHSFRAHGGILDKALGLSPEKSEEENVAAMDLYFNEDASGDEKVLRDAQRLGAKEACHTALDSEFFALGLQAGIFYDHSHISDKEAWSSPQVKDGSFDILTYHPTTLPGHSLPHAWLENAAGERTSTRYLVKPEKLLLLASSPVWQEIKHELVEIVVIGEEGSWQDVDGAWAEQCEVGAAGAVLVRPDCHVAYRWHGDRIFGYCADPNDEVGRVVRRVLMVSEKAF